ncbi:MAG: TPM domain-containing protein [Clostridiaceae bacterium]|nr:TPM domain-containing protein [Clostridiaceae bacterium]
MILTFILLIALSSTVLAYRELPLLVDNADLLTDYEEELLDSQLESISEKHKCEVAIVTVYSLEGKTAKEYADDFFDYNGYGYGEDDDGILLLISMEYSDWAMSTYGYAITEFPNKVLDYMADEFIPYLSSGDFYGAFLRYSERCDEVLTQGSSGSAYDTRKTLGLVPRLLISLGVGVLFALIITEIMKAQLKSVRYQPAASSYVRKNSVDIRQRTDLFLYSRVVRRAKPKSTSGSSTHRSSSGRIHGGRSGKF